MPQTLALIIPYFSVWVEVLCYYFDTKKVGKALNFALLSRYYFQSVGIEYFDAFAANFDQVI